MKRLVSILAVAAACASCANDDPVAAQLPFNEVGATGSDFVELYNTSGAPLAVAGYAVTDSRTDGFPRISSAIRIPAGTTVPANGYLVVLFEGECPTAGAGFVCVRGTAGGVSQTRGDTVHLLDPENQVVASVTVPPEAAPSGWTWGRFPNGTGAFKATRRTPGAINRE